MVAIRSTTPPTISIHHQSLYPTDHSLPSHPKTLTSGSAPDPVRPASAVAAAEVSSVGAGRTCAVAGPGLTLPLLLLGAAERVVVGAVTAAVAAVVVVVGVASIHCSAGDSGH